MRSPVVQKWSWNWLNFFSGCSSLQNVAATFCGDQTPNTADHTIQHRECWSDTDANSELHNSVSHNRSCYVDYVGPVAAQLGFEDVPFCWFRFQPWQIITQLPGTRAKNEKRDWALSLKFLAALKATSGTAGAVTLVTYCPLSVWSINPIDNQFLSCVKLYS